MISLINKTALGLIVIAVVFLFLVALVPRQPAFTIPPDIVKTMLSNVVFVTRKGALGAGSGFWLDNRHVLTNCHVGQVVGEYALLVDYSEKIVHRARLIACSLTYDLAVYESWWPNHYIHPLTIADLPPSLGASLYSAGYGLGGLLALKQGIANLSYTHQTNQIYGSLVTEITMPMISGDSGSPVFNSLGEVVGVAQAAVAFTVNNFPIPLASKTLMVSVTALHIFLAEVENGAYELPEV